MVWINFYASEFYFFHSAPLLLIHLWLSVRFTLALFTWMPFAYALVSGRFPLARSLHAVSTQSQYIYLQTHTSCTAPGVSTASEYRLISHQPGQSDHMTADYLSPQLTAGVIHQSLSRRSASALSADGPELTYQLSSQYCLRLKSHGPMSVRPTTPLAAGAAGCSRGLRRVSSASLLRCLPP